MGTTALHTHRLVVGRGRWLQSPLRWLLFFPGTLEGCSRSRRQVAGLPTRAEHRIQARAVLKQGVKALFGVASRARLESLLGGMHSHLNFHVVG